jgi:hypothetical protein
MNNNAIFRSVVVSLVLMLSTVAVVAMPTYAKSSKRVEVIKDDAGNVHSGESEYKESISESEKSFLAATGGKNAILASDGTINLFKSVVTKTGDEEKSTSDPFGTNAALLSINSSKIKVVKSEINTNANHAHAAFAYGNSTIEVNDSKINTVADNSGALVVAGGGTIITKNTSIETDKQSSASIRFNQGGGAMTISGGSIKSNAAENIVISDNSTIELDQVDFSINNQNNSGAFSIYKSTVEKFIIKNSTIKNERGDLFLADNSSANITLSKNDIKNTGTLIRAQNSNVSLSSKLELLTGDIIGDDSSVINLTFADRTSYQGIINAPKLSLTLDSKSRVVLTGDSYISELSNETADNSNIFANGHKLFINGKEAPINTKTPEEWRYDYSTDSTIPVEPEVKEDKSNLYLLLSMAIGAFIASIGITSFLFKHNKKQKRAMIEKAAIEKASKNTLKKPWEKA